VSGAKAFLVVRKPFRVVCEPFRVAYKAFRAVCKALCVVRKSFRGISYETPVDPWKRPDMVGTQLSESAGYCVGSGW